jgi:hypothetical protein
MSHRPSSTINSTTEEKQQLAKQQWTNKHLRHQSPTASKATWNMETIKEEQLDIVTALTTPLQQNVIKKHAETLKN